MRVKICGITSYEDAMIAIEAGADALGFVFYDKSPRYLSPQKARQIIEKLPPFVEKVALFVHESAASINEICRFTKATRAQIHFEADESLYSALDVAPLRVVRAQKKEDVLKFAEEYRLVDAYCEAYGGSGKRLNLEWFEGVDCSKIILAGGLSPENVEETKKYGFYAVDVSSGVELEKGVKDPQKVKDFIRYAK